MLQKALLLSKPLLDRTRGVPVSDPFPPVLVRWAPLLSEGGKHVKAQVHQPRRLGRGVVIEGQGAAAECSEASGLRVSATGPAAVAQGQVRV